MITPRYNWFSNQFWKYYSNRLLQTDFHAVTINHPITPPPNRSVLLLGNHFSWHDGFIATYLNHRFIHKQFHVLMLEEQLRQNMILRTAGAFSINRQGRDMVKSLQYAAQLLENSQNLLTLYPQGRIESMHNAQPTFEKGWFRILHQNPPTTVIYYVALTDYLANRKPNLNIHLLQLDTTSYNYEEIRSSFLDFYADCRKRAGTLYC
ncbi:MAG: 1-acyl-sn-glycerol-3-phosphate acyltransferase [Thermoflexibacteraceae bacterium]